VDYPDDDSMRISHETICQAIYVHPHVELKRELTAHLRTRRTARTRRGRTERRGAIPDPVSIHDRPEEVADPHAPWQRGSNENINGLLRQYLPKSTDLSQHTRADLQAIADRLNDRPRKRLAFRTPREAFAKLLTEDIERVATTTRI
jgi:IS30 family transposase